MEIVFTFAAMAVISTVLAIYLKDSGFSTAALLVTVCGGVLVFLKIIPFAADLFFSVEELSQTAGLRTDYLGLVLKAVCIAYVGEFASQICRDAGESGMAKKLDLGIKVVIMVMAMPLLQTILTTILDVFH